MQKAKGSQTDQRGKDRLTPERRSWNMSRIHGKDTKPEVAVRSMLHKMGYRFRLHVRIPIPPSTLKAQPKTLFVRPDIILPKYKTAIFVHGCFWHQHKGCVDCSRPHSNSEYWNKKLSTNVARDRRNLKMLRKLGWRVLTIWECETRDLTVLKKFLSKNPA